MRDVIITLIVLGSLPYAFKRPYIGVLMWVWISVMNPHRLSWGFAYSFPFAAIIAGVTLVGLLLTKDPKKLPNSPVVVVLVLFTAWMAIAALRSIGFTWRANQTSAATAAHAHQRCSKWMR